jgi:hypothetical protein
MRSVLVVLAIAGCYKDKAAVTAPPANKVGAPALATSDDVLAYLPKDSELVLGFDLIELRHGALYKAFEGELTQGVGAKLAEARQCGVDLMGGVERLTAGGKVSGSGEDFQGVVVVRGVDTARVLPCMAKHAADKGTVTNEGGVVTVTTANHQDTAAMAAGAMTLVMEFGPGVNKESIGRVLALGSPLRTSPAFMALYQRREPRVAMWGMVNGAAPFMAEVRKNGINPRSVDGTLRVTDELVAALRVTLGSPGEADQLVQSMTAVQGIVQPMLTRFDVRADGATVRLGATATEAQLRAMVGLLGKFGP